MRDYTVYVEVEIRRSFEFQIDGAEDEADAERQAREQLDHKCLDDVECVIVTNIEPDGEEYEVERGGE